VLYQLISLCTFVVFEGLDNCISSQIFFLWHNYFTDGIKRRDESNYFPPLQ
jgi:hypothetical protein